MSVTPELPADRDPEVVPKRRGPGLSAQVLIGLGLGILAGLFFGELIVPVAVVGEIFIALLQMTVLPYILISLIASLGRLSYAQVKLLALRGGRFVLLFWLLGLLIVAGFALAFPDWESATFFSSSLIERSQQADLVSLYVPANPFFALSNSIVPAVVVFGLALGFAVIGVPGKERFIDNLDVLGDAIMRIAGFVAKLAPIGVFALIAPAAGTLEVAALGRLQVYILTYVGTALILSFWILPGLVGVLSPVKPHRMMSAAQDALVTAFATNSLLIVLPLLVDRMKGLLADADIHDREADSAVDLIVPINFNLPNLGKLLSLAFVPFAGWFAGAALTGDQYPVFLLSGLLSFFGEVVVALPFLLDLVRIPADMFQLFLTVDIFTGRFGTLLAGVHTITLAVLTAVAVTGGTRLNLNAALRYAAISVGLILILFLGLRLFFEFVVPQKYQGYQQFVGMQLAVDRAPAREVDADGMRADPVGSDGTRLAAIRERGSLRVGYLKDSLPFVFRNDKGDIVGFEADMAHLLASELGVTLEFVKLTRKNFTEQMAKGRADIVMSGLFVTPGRALTVRFSESYLDATLGLVVPDHMRASFDTTEELRALDGARIAMPDIPYYDRFVTRHLPNLDVKIINSPRVFFRAERGEFDALLMSAEAGSAWTLIYPRFSVVVPQPNTVKAPVAIALPADARDLGTYVDTWLALQRKQGVIDQLFSYWILGEGALPKQPRWSIIRDVLGWVD